MQKQRVHWIFIFIFTLLFTGLACNLVGGEEETPTPEKVEPGQENTLSAPTPAAPTPEEQEEEPIEEAAAGAVSGLEDLENAVIQIVAEGSFVDPEFGLQLNIPGAGSGFIINEEGHAVTNNHVVTGAALLRVYLSGQDEPLNARVLGVSECSDLALIDLEGDGYPYFEWYDGFIKTGLEVFAAGFPLGDPEFTLTSGIVSKENAGGETNWSSVDAVIEHDATINPGNSGGPLVTADGKVVGVNYAGNTETRQHFAIARDEALEILEQLQAEQDVTSIGVNGFTVSDGDISGVWVSSVDSGSPADRAGIQGGDIITTLEGLVLGVDGTMADYCDILRSHRPEDILSVEVLRYATEEVLAGQLNGDELAVLFSFAQEVEEQVGEDFGETGATEYTDYFEVVDDTGELIMEVPLAWSDVDGSPLLDDDGTFLAASIQAASNIDGFWSTYDTPGVVFYAMDTFGEGADVEDLLNELSGSYECDYDGRYEYADEVYTGLYDLYFNCGIIGSVIIELAAVPEHQEYFTFLVIQAVSDADLDALDHILATFFVLEE
jgi:serine protease Do